MKKNAVHFWIIISFAMWALGKVWNNYDPQSGVAVFLNFFGWISSLLAVGYYSTPDSVYGKIAFGFVCIIVAGIFFKTLHYTGANELIIAGLLGAVLTYFTMWYRQRKAD